MYYLNLFDPWKGKLCTCPTKYSLQPYTGCSHKCLYCYATSYIRRKESTPKKDFIRKLARDLKKADPAIPISMSNSSDPYPPLEKELKLTRNALRLIFEHGFKVIIVTKSDIVARDVDLLKTANATVSITITTLREDLAKAMEPGAPSPLRRLKAVELLTREGVPVSVRIDPIVPGLNDDPAELEELVEKVVQAGALHIVTSTYKARPDSLVRLSEAFPEKAAYWRELYLKRGVRIGRAYYLEKPLRAKLLKPVVEAARREGVTYATCREGLLTREYFNAPTCDGTHLLELRREKK